MPDTHEVSGSMTALDPVCGMTVTADEAAGTHDHDGVTYYFCGTGCLQKFRDDPVGWLSGTAAAVEPTPEGTQYTCPMHPEVLQIGPGICPDCGMALEPATVQAPRTKTQYTCPMHPEVNQDEPGACPKCGMALEASVVTLDEEEDPELTDMRRRFGVCALLALPVFALAMGDHIPGNPVRD